MSKPIRSLVGRLYPDGSYQARTCHEDGFPVNQGERLAEALHRYHGGNADALFETILSRDWQRLAPAQAAAESSGTKHRAGTDGVAVYSGIGYFLTESSPEPVAGTVAESTTETYTWLYLWDGDQLRVYGNDHYRARWRFYNDIWLTSSSFADKWTL